jgi:hypothetical protein
MMDDQERKLFGMLDSDFPGERSNALELLREELKKKGRTFHQLAQELADSMSPAKVAELEKKLADYMAANAAAAKRDAALTREIATLKAALWVKLNRKTIGAVAAMLLVAVTGWWVYQRYWSRSEAVTAGLAAAVAAETWSEGLSAPVARTVGGEPYWLMFRGAIDASSYTDGHGRPVQMRCLHLYAAPAQPDSGQYFKPSTRNFLGRINWPELAVNCKPAPLQKVAR